MSSFPDPEKIELDLFHRFVDFRGKRVLEIGCGDGRTIRYYMNKAQWIVGIDNDREELIAARKETRLLKEDGFLNFIHGSAASLPFAASSFDLTILSWSL